MKRLLRNGKKAVAGLVLTMMAVCMVSSVSQGANSIDRYGSRMKDSKGYCSYTKVSAYDDRGYALNLKVGAKIGNGIWAYNSGSGTVIVKSAYSSNAGTAWHSYQIGSGSRVEWSGN
ncbi:MAG: hypothetical protein HFG34_06280 [Eubacterium sp.]|nr:hypothetical protein [Eubacterium sp.]